MLLAVESSAPLQPVQDMSRAHQPAQATSSSGAPSRSASACRWSARWWPCCDGCGRSKHPRPSRSRSTSPPACPSSKRPWSTAVRRIGPRVLGPLHATSGAASTAWSGTRRCARVTGHASVRMEPPRSVPRRGRWRACESRPTRRRADGPRMRPERQTPARIVTSRWGTLGDLATAAFVVAAASGAVVAVPYDPADAYGSIAAILLANPAGVLLPQRTLLVRPDLPRADPAPRVGPPQRED